MDPLWMGNGLCIPIYPACPSQSKIKLTFSKITSPIISMIYKEMKENIKFKIIKSKYL